ncbi:MAG: hypothetical protein PVF22_06320 [Candidatus Aminicenantes bacterium]
MSCSLSYVILAPLFGKLVDSISLSSSYLIMGVYFFFYAAIVLSRIFRRVQPHS